MAQERILRRNPQIMEEPMQSRMQLARWWPPLLVLLAVVAIQKLPGRTPADVPASQVLESDASESSPTVVQAQFLFSAPPLPPQALASSADDFRRLPSPTEAFVQPPATSAADFTGNDAGSLNQARESGSKYTVSAGSPEGQVVFPAQTGQDASASNGPSQQNAVGEGVLGSAALGVPRISSQSEFADFEGQPRDSILRSEPPAADAVTKQGPVESPSLADVPEAQPKQSASVYRLPPVSPTIDQSQPVPQLMGDVDSSGDSQQMVSDSDDVNVSNEVADVDDSEGTASSLPSFQPSASPALSAPSLSDPSLSAPSLSVPRLRPDAGPTVAESEAAGIPRDSRDSSFELLNEPSSLSTTASGDDYRRLPDVAAAQLVDSAAQPVDSAAQPIENAAQPIENAAQPIDNASLPLTPPGPVARDMARPRDDIGEMPSLPRSRVENAAVPISPATPRSELQPVRRSVAARQAGRLVQHGFELANRGALFAARAEFLQALDLIVEERDAVNGTDASAQALAEAWQALSEADDFLPKNSRSVFNRDLQPIIEMHRTKVLRGANLKGVNSVVALQHYYTFARNRLAKAMHGEPVAARALFAMGKLHTLFPKKSPADRRRNGQKAVAFHQAALMVNPNDHLAANELGVLLARAQQYEFAKEVFLKSLTVRPHAETWHNLAAVHRALGELDLQQRALHEKNHMLSFRQSPTPVAAGSSGVQWVSPEDFARSNPDRPRAQPAPTAAAPRSDLPSAGTRVPASISFQSANSSRNSNR